MRTLSNKAHGLESHANANPIYQGLLQGLTTHKSETSDWQVLQNPFLPTWQTPQ
jgi:hypothetical protein